MLNLGKMLFLFGVMLCLTPIIVGWNGPTEDPGINLMHRFPINKFVLFRAFIITGILFIMTGCVLA